MDAISSLPWYFSVPICLVATVLAGVLAYHAYMLMRFPGEAKVRWSWLPILGCAIELGERPVEFLRELSQNGEELVGVLIAGQRIFFVMDPFSAPVVFKNNEDYGQEEFHNQVLGGFFGVSDLTIKNLDGDMMRKWYVHYLLGYVHRRLGCEREETGRLPFVHLAPFSSLILAAFYC